MEPHAWDRLQEMYHAALQVPTGQRCDFVARACDFDPVLKKQICSLLKADESSPEFLKAPIFGLGLRILSGDDSTELPETPDADELISLTIDGRYLVESRLAVGGMARVYVARDLKLPPRRVVVKVLLDKSLRNERIAKKFDQEREALARVNHPGVVHITDAGWLADKPYIVMQYVEGVSLRETIAARPEGMEFDRAALIIKGIGAALNAVHEKQIYHRDLKPENIMVQGPGSASEHILVLDFGIAKVKGSLIASSTATGAGTMGTVVYMSPEQLRGDEVTAASDVYSFAVIAYEILTGRRPFIPDTPAHLLELQRQGVRAKPAVLRPRLSEDAEAIILNGLAFEPKSRSRGAGEFGDRLSRALLTEGPFDWERVPTTPMPPAGNNAPALTNPLDSPQLPNGPKAIRQTEETSLEPARKPRASRWLMLGAAAVLLLTVMIGSYWLISGNGKWFGTSPNSRSGSSLPHRTLTYSLTVQKMRDGLPYQDPFESSGQEIFENGYKFRLNVSSRQAGYLYVFNEGPPEKDQTSFTIIYPTPATNEGSRLEQNQNMQTNWNTFSGERGTERFWIIWSAAEVMPIEIARHEAFKNKEGAIVDAEVARNLRDFLSEHSMPAPETTKDTVKQRTSVRASGDLLVKLLELEHR
jgi:serine/threonine protein kinase